MGRATRPCHGLSGAGVRAVLALHGVGLGLRASAARDCDRWSCARLWTRDVRKSCAFGARACAAQARVEVRVSVRMRPPAPGSHTRTWRRSTPWPRERAAPQAASLHCPRGQRREAPTAEPPRPRDDTACAQRARADAEEAQRPVRRRACERRKWPLCAPHLAPRRRRRPALPRGQPARAAPADPMATRTPLADAARLRPRRWHASMGRVSLWRHRMPTGRLSHTMGRDTRPCHGLSGAGARAALQWAVHARGEADGRRRRGHGTTERLPRARGRAPRKGVPCGGGERREPRGCILHPAPAAAAGRPIVGARPRAQQFGVRRAAAVAAVAAVAGRDASGHAHCLCPRGMPSQTLTPGTGLAAGPHVEGRARTPSP